MNRLLSLLAVAGVLWGNQAEARETYTLNDNWHSVCHPEGGKDSLEVWKQTLPHNWDDYYGYRQYVHGNLHGTARYDRRFSLHALTHEDNAAKAQQQLYTLRLEGVGSYVTVWVNGKEICHHRPAGRVVTSLDITQALNLLNPRAENRLVIECEHPSNITDMPWVCGGCSSEWGFSEGSAPLGLFRGVSLEVTDPVRVEPFGVHAWANAARDTVYVDTEVRNYTQHGENVVVQSVLEGRLKKETFQLGAQLTQVIHQALPMREVQLEAWSPAHPQLYTLTTTVMRGTQHVECDRVQTTVGFSEVRWPQRTVEGKLCDTTEHRFLLNGEPILINGVCEYEHLFGQSHALTDEEIDYRCQLMQHMGFNAVRDAHQPHNLRYGDNYARLGMLWWPQFSAHIWYDTPQFRENFKLLLRQWVKERRNNPAIILWGIQNESTLPADFARECADIVRQMDPKTSQLGMTVEEEQYTEQQRVAVAGRRRRGRGRRRRRARTRMVTRNVTRTRQTEHFARLTDGRLTTTCNGGSGTDWNVIQNWSGTYGGKLADYGTELAKEDQLLNGEYGGWRTVGLHDQQSALALQDFDPKASWSEEHQCALLHAKLQQAYLNRDSLCGQFQWILASHDNPGRQQPDEFLRKIDKVGPLNYKGLLTATWEPTDAYYLYVAWGSFLRGEWPQDKAAPYLLKAREVIREGYRLDGVPLPDYLLDETATRDCSRPSLHRFAEKTSLLAPDPARTYLYRYNCGGDEMVDSYGNVWMGDDTRYSYSWAMAPQFRADSLCPVLGSQAMVRGWAIDPCDESGELLAARQDQPLLRSYRYGRHELQFSFPLPAGPIYQVELWLVDQKHRVQHVSYLTRGVWNGQLMVGFPAVKVGQAKVSAIAISLLQTQAREYGKVGKRGRFQFKRSALENREHPALAQRAGYPYSAGLTWAALDLDEVEKTDKATLPADKGGRPSAKFNAEEGQTQGGATFVIQMGLAQEYALRFRYKNVDQPLVRAHWRLLAQQDGRLVAEGNVTLPQTPNKFKVTSTTTGTFVNAGTYRLVVSEAAGCEFESVEVQ